MTTELEKQFFQCFGIEQKLPDYNEGYCDGCEINYDKCERYCPHKGLITDRILLELICISTASEITVCFKKIKSIEHLKEVVLNYCIERYSYHLHKDKFKHQVQAIFEGER